MDSQFILEEPVVVGRYCEAETSRTKTSNRHGTRRRQHFLVAPVAGVTGNTWCRDWLALRSRMGLAASEDQPLLPVPLAGGKWSSAAVDGFDLGLHLRTLLAKLGVDASLIGNVGSHSCKCTCLSWAAKFGLELKVRRTLGYHTDAADKSVHCYARDDMGAPLRELEKVISCVRRGTFMPDADRSGMFAKQQRTSVQCGAAYKF